MMSYDSFKHGFTSLPLALKKKFKKKKMQNLVVGPEFNIWNNYNLNLYNKKCIIFSPIDDNSKVSC